MRILIISDIHANLAALEAVLENARDYEAVWCLGDIVGYGPDPNECVETIRSLPNLVTLIGNHDAAALDQIDTASFNPEARRSVAWTQSQLTAENSAYLRSLPDHTKLENVTLAHGSPRQPIWEYLMDVRAATQNFEYFETPFCFVGHSHLPVIYTLTNGWGLANLTIPEPNTSIQMSARSILNPGSVGQPRDRDPRAAYAIFDTAENKWEYCRVPYDIPKVQERMLAFGLPHRHIQRLQAGW